MVVAKPVYGVVHATSHPIEIACPSPCAREIAMVIIDPVGSVIRRSSISQDDLAVRVFSNTPSSSPVLHHLYLAGVMVRSSHRGRLCNNGCGLDGRVHTPHQRLGETSAQDHSVSFLPQALEHAMHSRDRFPRPLIINEPQTPPIPDQRFIIINHG